MNVLAHGNQANAWKKYSYSKAIQWLERTVMEIKFPELDPRRHSRIRHTYLYSPRATYLHIIDLLLSHYSQLHNA